MNRRGWRGREGGRKEGEEKIYFFLTHIVLSAIKYNNLTANTFLIPCPLRAGCWLLGPFQFYVPCISTAFEIVTKYKWMGWLKNGNVQPWKWILKLVWTASKNQRQIILNYFLQSLAIIKSPYSYNWSLLPYESKNMDNFGNPKFHYFHGCDEKKGVWWKYSTTF